MPHLATAGPGSNSREHEAPKPTWLLAWEPSSSYKGNSIPHLLFSAVTPLPRGWIRGPAQQLEQSCIPVSWQLPAHPALPRYTLTPAWESPTPPEAEQGAPPAHC